MSGIACSKAYVDFAIFLCKLIEFQSEKQKIWKAFETETTKKYKNAVKLSFNLLGFLFCPNAPVVAFFKRLDFLFFTVLFVFYF